MKTLILLGSPRKRGNTSILLGKVRQGLHEENCSTELIHLNNLKIRPCQGCGGCDKTGRCVIPDEMQSIYPKIDAADALVIASPIYFYSVTAQTKALVDRTQAMWSRKYNLNQKLTPEQQNRCGYLVSLAATRGKKIFEGASMVTQYALDALGVEYCDNLLVRGVDGRGAILKNQEELERAYQFGKQIAATYFLKKSQEPA